jgi:trehalose 6-phosphate synthase
MGRLVVVSNRVGPIRGAAAAGGLAVALLDALRERGGLWFGWSGRIGGGAHAHEPRVRTSGALTLATVDLTPEDYAGYYNGFSNRCLWPLFHFRIDLSRYDPREYETYRRVNAALARQLLPLLRRDDRLWIHDYHLFPLASELRALGARQRIGFFLHIPFPPRDILNTMPAHEQLVRTLFDCDLLGFQTGPDLDRFHDYVEHEARGRVRGIRTSAYGRELRAGAFPIGIDVGQIQLQAQSPRGLREARALSESLRGRHQIIGVDRLDYSKGLLRRLSAYEALLEQHADAQGQVEFLQIAPVSREELHAYRDFRRELEQAAARINGRHARLDWTPVRFLMRALPRATLVPLYRASRIGLVTPVRDGMNLVAKEYVAAQDPVDPGVLVLSCFAGAAQQMRAALLVNPYDAAATAEALQRARTLSAEERRARHAELLRGLVDFDVKRWREEFTDELAGPRRRAVAKRRTPVRGASAPAVFPRRHGKPAATQGLGRH